MTIHLDTTNNQTLCRCDMCGLVHATDQANGVVPADWMTGHLWLDVSLSEQKQFPITFCPDCRSHLLAGTVWVVAEPAAPEEPAELEEA